MALDGIVVAGIVKECRERLVGCRLYKIAQPEADELLLTIKGQSSQSRLLISSDASLPFVYFTEKNKTSPMTAPNFCMLLRKHIQNGRITDVKQPGLERIIRFEIEHLNELGDVCRKYLVVELMGKHSNIIFCDDNNIIIDSIKHVSALVSSVREVLPGKPYFIPETTEKTDPGQFLEEATFTAFKILVFTKAIPLAKALYTTFTGFSPIAAQELCYRAKLDSERAAFSFEDEASQKKLYDVFITVMKEIEAETFIPNIVYQGQIPHEFSVISLTLYEEETRKDFSSISEVLETYYAEKNQYTRIRQKSADLRKIVSTLLERTVRKYDLQCRQIKDTEKREKYKIYGELLHTYGYSVKPNDRELTTTDYHTGEEITIPLDPTLNAFENAKRYFDKYGKLKRTYETLSILTKEVEEEIHHLQSISTALDIAEKEEDLTEIKEELIESGYMKRKGGKKKEKITSRPFRFVSSDGFPIYVGKNNFQNEKLTFHLASGNDWWFHTKTIPGSHVIVKCDGKMPPDSTFEEAAKLAAHYSKGRGNDRVEIDYTEKKNVKKPSGGKPGFVIYHTNYSMVSDSDISGIQMSGN